MPSEIKAYECEHGCGKFYRSKSSAVSHEKRCWWNPARRACASCGNQDEDRYCPVYELDLSQKGALRAGCLGWIPKVEAASF